MQKLNIKAELRNFIYKLNLETMKQSMTYLALAAIAKAGRSNQTDLE